MTNEVVIKKQEPSSNAKQATNQIQVQNQQQANNQHGSILVAQLSGKNVIILIFKTSASSNFVL